MVPSPGASGRRRLGISPCSGRPVVACTSPHQVKEPPIHRRAGVRDQHAVARPYSRTRTRVQGVTAIDGSKRAYGRTREFLPLVTLAPGEKHTSEPQCASNTTTGELATHARSRATMTTGGGGSGHDDEDDSGGTDDDNCPWRRRSRCRAGLRDDRNERRGRGGRRAAYDTVEMPHRCLFLGGRALHAVTNRAW